MVSSRKGFLSPCPNAVLPRRLSQVPHTPCSQMSGYTLEPLSLIVETNNCYQLWAVGSVGSCGVGWVWGHPLEGWGHPLEGWGHPLEGWCQEAHPSR